MKVKILLLLLATAVAFATTKTYTTFTPEVNSTDDEYGNKRYTRVVSIETQGYEIDNFFGKFSDNNNSNYQSLAKKASFEITVEANSICSNDEELAEEGCSGQKPFLINSSLLDNAELKDENDNELYHIPYGDYSDYTPSKDDAFFALDIDRDTEFYQETTTEGGKKSFFQKIRDMFKSHFSNDVDVLLDDELSSEEKTRRERYIANIVSGIQKDKRLTKKVDGKGENTPINSGVNNPVSLIDYDSINIAQTTGCKAGFLTLSSSSLTCKMISGFSMAEWMPFFNETNEVDTETSSVMADTETSLLTAVGLLNNTNVFNNMKDDLENNTSFFGEIFKPITNMFDKMMSFFFGTREDAKAEIISNYYDLTKYDKQLTMTMPITSNGSVIDDFVNFVLVGLDSVYGTEVTTCKVKHTYWETVMFFPVKKTKNYTITSSDNEVKEYYIDSGMSVSESVYESKYDELNFNDDGFNDINLETTRDEMLAWCAREQAHNSKGIIGRIKDMLGVSSLLMWNRTKDEQMDALLDDKGFEVTSYEEKNHRGLILHLKKENLTTDNPANSISIKYMKSVK